MKNVILIVDDDKVFCDTLSYSLKKENFYVITAFSAEEAYSILEKITVDGIILDRMMSGIDGLSFLKKLRNNDNNTPVLMLTALAETDDIIEGLTEGANDYLGKPFKIKELVLRLNNILRQNFNLKKINLPSNLLIEEGEFLVKMTDDKIIHLKLSKTEKKLLTDLLNPFGNVVHSNSMIAKRLRLKLNQYLFNIDMITVRSKGYKLIQKG